LSRIWNRFIFQTDIFPAAQLHRKAMKQLSENKIQEMKEKDARVHKI